MDLISCMLNDITDRHTANTRMFLEKNKELVAGEIGKLTGYRLARELLSQLLDLKYLFGDLSGDQQNVRNAEEAIERARQNGIYLDKCRRELPDWIDEMNG